MQIIECRNQGRDRAGIERLQATESIAEIFVQVIAVLDACIRLCEKPLVLFWATRLQLIEPLHQHVDREATELQVPGEMR
jgi:hypothetical protein